MRKAAMVLIGAILLSACQPSDEAPPVSVAEPIEEQVESEVTAEDPEPNTAGFDTGEIGERYEVLVETTADLGFGFDSRIIGLNDEKQVRDEAQRTTLHLFVVETSPGRFSTMDFFTHLPDDRWWQPFQQAWQNFSQTMEAAGEWHTYFGILDYNRNGRNEIFGVNASSCCMTLHVWESDDTGMRSVIDYAPHGTRLSDLALPVDGLIRVIDLLSVPDDYELFEFRWNAESATYEHVTTTETNVGTFD